MKKNLFSVDIGGSKLICGALTRTGEILESVRFDYAPGYTVEMLTDMIREGYLRLSAYEFDACGAAIPGLCDPKAGTWIYSPFSGIGDVPVAQILHGITGLPVFVDNDVNVSALAERCFGACPDSEDFLWITVSNGIGGGLFLRGDLYRGARMTAGEIGHVIVEEVNGRVCGCGNRGCLEAMASGASIAAIYAERTGKRIDTKTLAALARDGDAESARVFSEAGAYIGKAAAHTVNLLGLDTVVIGGGVSESFDLIEAGIRSAFGRFVFEKANPSVAVLPSALGRYAALKGGAALVLYAEERA